MTVEVNAQYEDGDTVVMRSTFHGTHSGTFAGLPATGKRVSVETIDITRFDGDRMVEHWGQMDGAALMGQLGLLPGT
jgi:predicted ester cyclase